MRTAWRSRGFGVMAALVAVMAPLSAQAEEPVLSWLYLGGHAGYIVSERQTHLPAPFPADIDPQDRNGWAGGGLAGFAFRHGPWALGGEVDLTLASEGPRQTVFQPASTVAWHQYTEINWLSSARARLGVVWNRWHLYGTAGAAWAQMSARLVATDGATETGRGTADAVHAGWVAGAGVDVEVSRQWMLRLEYLHYDFGSAAYGFAGVAGAETSADLTVDSVRAAVTYQFR